MLDALHFILDSYWNTFAVVMVAVVFRPVRVTINRKADDNDD